MGHVAPPEAPGARRTGLIVTLALAGALAAGVAVAIPLTLANIAAAEEAEREAEQKAAEAAAAAAEEQRLKLFNVALGSCGVQHFSLAGITILDGGEAVELKGVGESFISRVQLEDVECFLSELGAPSSVAVKWGKLEHSTGHGQRTGTGSPRSGHTTRMTG